MPQIYGHTGWSRLGATQILCREGSGHNFDRTLDPAYPISNHHFGLFNVAEGVRQPQITLIAIPMEEWFTAAWLNATFITRTATPVFDLSEVAAGVEFADANALDGAVRMLGAKGGGFSLSVSKAQTMVGFQMRFLGTDSHYNGEGGVVIVAPNAGFDGTIISAPAATLTGDFVNAGIEQVTVNFDTGATPNMEIDGTMRPKEINCDIPTATIQVTMQALSTRQPPGWAANPANYTEVAAGVTIPSSLGDVIFSAARMKLVNPDNKSQQRGRVRRTYTYMCLSTATQYPIEIA